MNGLLKVLEKYRKLSFSERDKVLRSELFFNFFTRQQNGIATSKKVVVVK